MIILLSHSKAVITVILCFLLVHRPEKCPSSEAESEFFGRGGSLRKRRRGGRRGRWGSRGGSLDRRLAREEFLEH